MVRDDFISYIDEIAPDFIIASPGHCVLDVARDKGVAFLELDDARLPELLAGHEPLPAVLAAPDDDCLFLVTSGTTGHPKIIPHTHAHFFAVAKHTGDFIGLRPDDVVLCSAKMSHAYGLFMSLTLPLHVGAAVVLDPEKPAADRTLKLLFEERVTVFASVPALYGLLLLSLDESARLERLRLCFSAGEALPAAVHEAWRRTTGLELGSGYGSTENMTFVIGARPPDFTPATTGRLIPPYEAVILDADGAPAEPGETGHLAVRGPTVMTGYHNAAFWTERVFTQGGYQLTGDMAVARDGVFTILGRMDDMFKTGGLWASPTRVENALLSHGAVAQCAVVGGSAGAFTLVRAHVVVKPGVSPDDSLKKDLTRHAAALLPDFMVPADIVFRDELPLTASGKVQRFKLRQTS